MHALILAALIFGGCVNCPPNGIVATNTVTISIGTNVNILASAVMSNGMLVVTADVSSNQLNAVSAQIGTNLTPSQLIMNGR